MRTNAEIEGAQVDTDGFRPARRRLLTAAIAGGAAMAALPTGALAQSQAFTEKDYLNFFLNIEYLLNQYYRRGVWGIDTLESNRTSGSGTPGGTTGGPRQWGTGITRLKHATISPIAEHLLLYQGSQLDMIRNLVRAEVVAQPALDIAGGANGAFTKFMRYAGVIDSTATFDPYGSAVDFMLGAYVLGDVSQRVLRTIVPMITDSVAGNPLSGLLGSHAVFSGIVREVLMREAIVNPSVNDRVSKITQAFNTLTNTTVAQGVVPATVNGVSVANHSPSDSDGMITALTPQQVLNILYINRGATTSGGFFPAGVNGTIKTSAV